MNSTKKWAVIVPMANEEHDFYPFISALQKELDVLKNGQVFLIVDNVSKDKTLELCRQLSENDKRFHTVWAPENRNVVDAYIRGYKEALKNSDADYIIEMDAGLSHDPASLEAILDSLDKGTPCVFGSRFIEGGSMGDSPAKRQSLSKTGTVLSNILLGTKLHDMTSGYQGFHRSVVEKFTAYELKSKAHFYQTEIRYLLRKYPSQEIPIHYQAPSPRVSKKAITNSIETLLYYFWRRITFRSISI
jgi:dolichol-phosphate mannosyltransferase